MKGFYLGLAKGLATVFGLSLAVFISTVVYMWTTDLYYSHRAPRYGTPTLQPAAPAASRTPGDHPGTEPGAGHPRSDGGDAAAYRADARAGDAATPRPDARAGPPDFHWRKWLAVLAFALGVTALAIGVCIFVGHYSS